MDQSRQSSQARFSIGIDLGTTHCALSYVDRQASDGEKVEQGVLEIPSSPAPPAWRHARCCRPSSTCRMKAS